jgi:hypothetical protein
MLPLPSAPWRDQPRAEPLALSGQAATVSPVKRNLRLHLQDLSDHELAKVNAFLRIGRERLQCDWNVVFDGEFDVLMRGVDGAGVPGNTGSPLAQLCVADAGTGRHDAVETLAHPLQYEALLDALSALENRFATTPAVHATPRVLPPDARFRLLRWPPAELLQGNRDRQRLASFLLTRLVGLDELARLSHVDKPQCAEFVALLATTGTLDITTADALPARIDAGSEPEAHHQELDANHFATIRNGLGLTW